MEGYLDYLETTGPLGLRRKIWVRRFFKLNEAFHVLEIFTDETQYERRRKLELRGATVSTADELGGLLNDDKVAAEMSRRFIFRITESSKKHHYLCPGLNGSKIPTLTSYEGASITRNYMEKWCHALDTTIAAGEETFFSAASMRLSSLNSQIAAFMNNLHLSARISNHFRDHGQSIYEITVKAWILERELIKVDIEHDGYCRYTHDSRGNRDVLWQISEFSCTWKMMKSTEELRNFDRQIRQFNGSGMLNLVFPSRSISDKLQHLHFYASATQKEAENNQHIQIYDTYLQFLLHLPELSLFASDASKMFDTFLDISTHLVSFRKLEKKSGLNMHLGDRKVVPWKDRERFEVVYNMHLQNIAAQEENARRVLMDKTVSSHEKTTPSRHNRQICHRYLETSNGMAKTEAKDSKRALKKPCTASLPAPVEISVSAEEVRPNEAVQDRIARIGHRLIIEAFET